jgi:L-threonylcarbamoyladenylate synthase
MEIDPLRPDPSAIATAVDVLKAGGIIVFPTETYYALGADAYQEAAVRRIFDIKQRPGNKPMILLIAGREALNRLVADIPPSADLLMKKFWPGPLTLVFNASPSLPPVLLGGTGKVAIRLPAHRLIRDLVVALDGPLTGTSLNLSGRPSISDPHEVYAFGREKVDLILDGGSTPGGAPSTLVDITLDPPRILREGRIPSREILQLF